MHMLDWVKKLDAFLNFNERSILTHAGQISHEMAIERAQSEYDRYHSKRIKAQDQKESDFDKTVKKLTDGRKRKKPSKF